MANLKEAIDSGKRFRIKSASTKNEWFNSRGEFYEYLASQDNPNIIESTFNSDFEIEEKRVSITESQFNKAFELSLTKSNTCVDTRKFKKMLGFK